MSARESRRRPLTITLCVWTLLVWTTRVGNIWGDDDLTTGERWGRTALAMSFTLLAVAVGYALYRRQPWLGRAVTALAGWTIGVWAVRAIGIAAGDHDAAFVIVHLVLAVVSTALAVLAVREQPRATEEATHA
jgi:hypothetical protein